MSSVNTSYLGLFSIYFWIGAYMVHLLDVCDHLFKYIYRILEYLTRISLIRSVPAVNQDGPETWTVGLCSHGVTTILLNTTTSRVMGPMMDATFESIECLMEDN